MSEQGTIAAEQALANAKANGEELSWAEKRALRKEAKDQQLKHEGHVAEAHDQQYEDQVFDISQARVVSARYDASSNRALIDLSDVKPGEEIRIDLEDAIAEHKAATNWQPGDERCDVILENPPEVGEGEACVRAFVRQDEVSENGMVYAMENQPKEVQKNVKIEVFAVTVPAANQDKNHTMVIDEETGIVTMYDEHGQIFMQNHKDNFAIQEGDEVRVVSPEEYARISGVVNVYHGVVPETPEARVALMETLKAEQEKSQTIDVTQAWQQYAFGSEPEREEPQAEAEQQPWQGAPFLAPQQPQQEQPTMGPLAPTSPAEVEPNAQAQMANIMQGEHIPAAAQIAHKEHEDTAAQLPSPAISNAEALLRRDNESVRET